MRILSICLLSLFLQTLNAQVPTFQDCLGAIPLCGLVYEQTDPSKYVGMGRFKDEILRLNDDDCMLDERSGLWYIFNAQSTGILRFVIKPYDDLDDYDWDLFDLTEGKCSDLAVRPHDFLVSANCFGNHPGGLNGLTGINSKLSGGKAGDCNGPGEFLGPPFNDDLTVFKDHTYLLYITFALNPDAGPVASKGFKLDFTESEASLFNSSSTNIKVLNKTHVWAGDTLIDFNFNKRVKCASVTASDFNLINNGSPIDLKKITSNECRLGGIYGQTFQVISKTPFLPGKGSLVLKGQVDDACNNVSSQHQLDFTVAGILIKDEKFSPIKCDNPNSGEINISAESEASPLFYSIDGGKTYNESKTIFTNLHAADYQIDVKNKFGYHVLGSIIQLKPYLKHTFEVKSIQAVQTCAGASEGSFQLQFTPTALSYQISLDGGLNFSNYQPNSSIQNLKANQYKVILKDNLACESASVLVTISNPEPVIFDYTFKTIQCHSDKNGFIQFTNKSVYSILEYSVDGGKKYNSNAKFTQLNAGAYQLMARNSKKCISEKLNIELKQPLKMNLGDQHLTSIKYDEIANGGSFLVNASGGIAPLIYTLNGKQSNNTGLFENIPEGPFYVTVTDSLGCQLKTETKIMRIKPSIETVNTFTPNGDGHNDLWEIKNIEEYPNAVVTFYDRWNHFLYKAETGYPNAWDGYVDGKPLPTATYYYTIDLGEKFKIISGFITLIR